MAVGEALTNLAARRGGRSEARSKLSANWMAAAGHGGRGRGPVRHGARGGARAVPGARHQHPRGQGFPVDAHRVGGGRAAERGDRAAVADRLGVRALRGRAQDAARRSSRPAPARPSCCSSISGAGATAWADRFSPRSTGSAATRRPTWTSRSCSPAFFAAIQDLATGKALLLAYHDRSDGGLFATVCEMAFAAHAGVTRQPGPARLRRGRARRRRERAQARADVQAAISSACSRRCSPRSWAR